MAVPSAPIYMPVIYFDGDCEFDAGNVAFDPTLGFEKLRSIICQKIGADPRRIGIFLSCRRKSKARDGYRKMPIHKNSDLTAIAREKNCFFYVFLKQPAAAVGKERRRRARRDFRESDPIPTILRRDRPEDIGILGRRLGLGFTDYESKIRELQRQTEYLPVHRNSYVSDDESAGKKSITCEQCLSEERPIPFHLCVHDAVTIDFRSPAGPIERPTK